MPTQTFLVTGVDFVTVPTKDYDAAAKFYGEVLGLPFGKRWGKMPAGEFETGNLRPDEPGGWTAAQPSLPARTVC